jgi:16S rRNA (uracil1498-N3)-methyltransferase
MTRRRWIADEVSGTHAALTGNHAEHLARVLRARVGEEFEISIGARVHRGRITGIEKSRVEFELGDEIPAKAIPHVTVVLSIFKFDRLEWAIEKCTELGVARIIPVIAHRTDANLASAASKRRERWQRIALQASEQSRRALPPEISSPTKLKEAVALPGNTRIVLAESEQTLTLKDALQSSSSDLVLAFGPEGGWTEVEINLFREAGWMSASLGSTILRVETAVIAALAVAMSELQ